MVRKHMMHLAGHMMTTFLVPVAAAMEKCVQRKATRYDNMGWYWGDAPVEHAFKVFSSFVSPPFPPSTVRTVEEIEAFLPSVLRMAIHLQRSICPKTGFLSYGPVHGARAAAQTLQWLSEYLDFLFRYQRGRDLISKGLLVDVTRTVHSLQASERDIWRDLEVIVELKKLKGVVDVIKRGSSVDPQLEVVVTTETTSIGILAGSEVRNHPTRRAPCGDMLMGTFSDAVRVVVRRYTYTEIKVVYRPNANAQLHRRI